MRNRFNSNTPHEPRRQFPFRQDNRRRDGTWNAEDATPENIKGTSVDPHDPVWPRWKKKPPLHGEGEFISDEPFFDIDEITQKATLYPPGTPLVDRNVDGNPASRQRVNDSLTGNLWRRRLLVQARGVGRETTPSGHGSAANARSAGADRRTVITGASNESNPTGVRALLSDGNELFSTYEQAATEAGNRIQMLGEATGGLEYGYMIYPTGNQWALSWPLTSHWNKGIEFTEDSLRDFFSRHPENVTYLHGHTEKGETRHIFSEADKEAAATMRDLGGRNLRFLNIYEGQAHRLEPTLPRGQVPCGLGSTRC